MTINQYEKQSYDEAKKLLTPFQLSRRLAVPTATLAYWRVTDQGPKFLKIGRHVRYEARDVEDWLLDRRGGDDA